MKKHVGIFANTKKAVLKTTLHKFCKDIPPGKYQFLASDVLEPFLPSSSPGIEIVSLQNLLNKSDLIVSFGGDGTMLRSARLIGSKEIPILGINLGGLGFLTATSAALAIKHIDQFFGKELQVEKRSALKLNIGTEPTAKYFLNDIVVDKAGFPRLIKIITNVDEQLLNSYVADGLIIATPTGSTAYSLANGGPIVTPATNAVIINPICPHTLSNRPIVISDEAVISIRIESEMGKFNVFGDGEKIGTYPLQTTVKLCKAEFNVCLVQVPGHEFYTILREKLGWGDILREKNRSTSLVHK